MFGNAPETLGCTAGAAVALTLGVAFPPPWKGRARRAQTQRARLGAATRTTRAGSRVVLDAAGRAPRTVAAAMAGSPPGSAFFSGMPAPGGAVALLVAAGYAAGIWWLCLGQRIRAAARRQLMVVSTCVCAPHGSSWLGLRAGKPTGCVGAARTPRHGPAVRQQEYHARPLSVASVWGVVAELH
jgi:hypothetical protein